MLVASGCSWRMRRRNAGPREIWNKAAFAWGSTYLHEGYWQESAHVKRNREVMRIWFANACLEGK